LHTLLRLLFIFSLLLICCNGFCQSFHRYSFNRISRANGLLSDDVTSVAQDRKGYIWIAGYNGLQRYDGTRFISYVHNPADSFSIPPEGIHHILYDSRGRLWLLTAGNKIGIFDIAAGRFHKVTIALPAEHRNNQILRFKEDKDSNLLIQIHNYGIATYNEKQKQFSSAYNTVKPDDGSFAVDITTDMAGGKQYVSTNKKFKVYNTISRSFIPSEKSFFLSGINRFIEAENAAGAVDIFKDANGRLWFNTWSYKKGTPEVFNYDSVNKKWNYYSSSIMAAARGYHEINGFLEQKNGSIWIYGNNVFARLNNQLNIFEDVRNEGLQSPSIPFEMIYRLFEDKDENIWICANNGLYVFNPQRQFISTFINKRRDGLEQHFESDVILQTQSGKIFTTIWGRGIFAYDSLFRPIANPIIPDEKNEAQSIWDMYERKNGQIWMGVQGGSVYLFDQRTNRLKKIKPPAIEGRTIRQVTEDSLGNMWLGTQSGLIVKCIGANFSDTVNSYRLIRRVNAHITKMYTDSAGRIWVGTERDGAYVIDPSTDKITDHYIDHADASHSIPGVNVDDIMQYNDSLIMLTSGGVNIINIRRGTVTNINTGSGLPSNDITALAKDAEGYVWLGSHSGLYRMQIGSNIFLTFGAEDGIIFGRRKITTVTPFRDGRLVFGSTTDLLIVNTAQMKLPELSNPVSLSDFRIFDQRKSIDNIMQSGTITLPYNENAITLDLTTFTYNNSPIIMYKMDGVDKNWKPASGKQVVYNYLAPGNYVFKAKSIAATGKESEKIFEIKVDIEPPFWQSWWFYGLLILAAISILYLLDTERMNKLRSNQQLRTDIAMNLHEEVSTALNNINLMSEMALRKADTDTKRSKEIIGQIREKSNDMIIAMDDMLWSIDPENDNMQQTLLRMSEFIDALKNRHNASIIMTVDEEAKYLKPAMKVRHGFFIVFKEALRIICQHSGGKNTRIQMTLEKNNLTIKIEDNVAVNAEDIKVSKNLEAIYLHAGQINADVNIQMEKDLTTIELTVPLSGS
jgi:ligand-binding sensor domain-containing protein/signal transduction histidine kinase